MAYTNSPLVSYTRISPHRTKNRKHAIDTITIHCIVGQWTAKKGCDYFATTERDVSANYVIGKDGMIGLAVEEKDRSWCSSNPDNDHRAVTIEVASDTKSPYAVTAEAYAALLDLVTDICKRNGIKELLWKADKSLIGQVDKQNMTVHRWFASKSCPGEYLYSRHGEIAAEVNKRLSSEQDSPAVVVPEQPSTETDSAETIWDFLIARGINAYAVAGIMGNLYAESALKPTNLQNTYEKKLGLSDTEYTQAVDDGTYDNFVNDSAGYGLAQWTFWSRKQALLDYAKSVKKSVGDLQTQLEFLWQEIQGYTSVMTALEAATSVQEASDAVMVGYERPANQSAAAKTKRANYGKKYYDLYAFAAETTVFTPYRVKITTSALNIRKQPTTSSAVTGVIRDRGVYTIVEEASGAGATGWGKLKSGAGWISLDYTKKV